MRTLQFAAPTTRAASAVRVVPVPTDRSIVQRLGGSISELGKVEQSLQSNAAETPRKVEPPTRPRPEKKSQTFERPKGFFD